MDIAGHVWQTSALLLPLQKPKKIIQGVIWGLVPDIVGLYYVIWDRLLGWWTNTPISDQELNQFLSWAYPLGHSLVTFVLVFLFVAMVRYGYWALLGGEFYLGHRQQDKYRYYHWPMFGWAFHIALDGISHQRFSTPYFWPIFGGKLQGVFDYANNFTYDLINSVLYVIFFAILAVVYFSRK